MKTFSFLLLLTLGFSACTPTPDFHVALRILDEEVSDDSNSREETLTIDGYRGTYTWTYDGYRPDEDFDTERDYSFKLTDEELASLTLLIRENGLMVSRDDVVSTGEPWTAFDVTWDNSMGGQRASGHVVGEPVAWEDWQATKGQMAKDESLFAAETVMEFVKEKVGFEY